MESLKINSKKYVIGVDGGGSKTTAILADLNGKILAKAKTGSSHPRNLGLEKAVESVVFVIEKVLRKVKKEKNIYVTFLGLPTTEEEFKFKKNLIKKELLKYKRISSIFKGKVIIGSDQLAGFRSGTDEKDGIVLIAGSGCVCHGWQGKNEAKVDGWGYLNEMGSAFFTGQKTLQATFKELDGRKKKTLLVEKVLRGLKAKNKEELIRMVYCKTPMEIIPTLSIYCDKAAQEGDRLAKDILIEAGKELALSFKTVIKKLRFRKKNFPVVLIGSMFNSRTFFNAVKKEIKKLAKKAEIIRPKEEPVFGAVNLAIETVVSDIAEKLKKGEVIICPTDTVYGLVCDAANKRAVEKIFKIKKRKKNKFLPVFIESLEKAKKLAIIDENQKKFLKSVWPGKTTAILKRKRGHKLYGVDKNTIALRIPKFKLILELLKKTNKPLIGTSANISQKPAATKIEDVLGQFQNEKRQPDIVSFGDLKPSKPSTIIDLRGNNLKILRR